VARVFGATRTGTANVSPFWKSSDPGDFGSC
jgi:hypothetical protein